MILPKNVEYIIEVLNKNGFEAYAVGGCVRDSLMGREPKDWDITTSAKPEDVKSVFDHTVDTGIAHGTVTVLIGKEGYEVTTFRIDGKYRDNRHPENVTFTACLEEDLSRRDFTVNAIAYSHKTGFVDMFGGMEDIKNGIIKGVGDPGKRFREDALRMLRALRFSAQLSFEIEKNTYDALKENKDLILNISTERIRDEITKLIMTDMPCKLGDVKECGLLELILPWVSYNINPETMSAMKNSPKVLPVRLALLFQNTENTDKILKALTYDNKTNKNVCTILKYAPELTEDIYTVRKILGITGKEIFDCIVDYKSSLGENTENISKICKTVIDNKDCINLKGLAITGKDLIPLGIKGEKVGIILNKCLDMVLKEPTRNKKNILMEEVIKCML